MTRNWAVLEAQRRDPRTDRRGDRTADPTNEHRQLGLGMPDTESCSLARRPLAVGAGAGQPAPIGGGSAAALLSTEWFIYLSVVRAGQIRQLSSMSRPERRPDAVMEHAPPLGVISLRRPSRVAPGNGEGAADAVPTAVADWPWNALCGMPST